MAAGEFGFSETIDKDETADAPESSVHTRRQFKHQRRAVAYRARNVGQKEKIDVARAPGAEAQVGHYAAVLQRGPDGAAEIDPAPRRGVQPASESYAEASSERRQGVARGFVIEVG